MKNEKNTTVGATPASSNIKGAALPSTKAVHVNEAGGGTQLPPGLKLEKHPLADLFPPLTKDEMHALVEDIRKNGLRQPIAKYEGKILDGANRYVACGEAGVTPEFFEWKGGDPYAWVISQNAHRRHLKPSQRGACAAEAIAKKFSRNGEVGRLGKDAVIVEAEKVWGVSAAYIYQAIALLQDNPEEFAKVKAGEITLSLVQKEKAAKHPRNQEVSLAAPYAVDDLLGTCARLCGEDKRLKLLILQAREPYSAVVKEMGELPEHDKVLVPSLLRAALAFAKMDTFDGHEDRLKLVQKVIGTLKGKPEKRAKAKKQQDEAPVAEPDEEEEATE